MAGRGTILKNFPIHFINWALLFLLTACSGGLLPGGSVGGPLGQGSSVPTLGSGSATGDEDDAANGGDGSQDDGDSGSGLVTSNVPLDGGVVGPPIYDHPNKPPQITGEIKIICKTNSLVKVKITGSARHDNPYDDEDFVPYEANRTLRIKDEADDKCLDIPLEAAEGSSSQDPRNHFETVFFTSHSFSDHLKFFLSQPDFEPEDSFKHDCGGAPVLQIQGRSYWTKLFVLGLFFNSNIEAQMAEAPGCEIDIPSEATAQKYL